MTTPSHTGQRPKSPSSGPAVIMGTLGSVLCSLIVGILGWALIVIVLIGAFLLGAEVISYLPHLQRQPPAPTPAIGATSIPTMLPLP
jgi:hypothetical protein